MGRHEAVACWRERAQADMPIEEPAPFFAEVADAPDGAEARWLRPDGVRLRSDRLAAGRARHRLPVLGRTEYAEKYGRTARRFAAGASRSRRSTGADEIVGPLCAQSQARLPGFPPVSAGCGKPCSARLRCARCPSPVSSAIRWGAIALRSCSSAPDFAGAVFCAPMWQLRWRQQRASPNRATQLAQLLGAKRLPGTSDEAGARQRFDGNR